MVKSSRIFFNYFLLSVSIVVLTMGVFNIDLSSNADIDKLSETDNVSSIADKIDNNIRSSDKVTVMFDDAHFPAYTADPANDADESVGGCAGGYSDFADVLRDPLGMQASHPGHQFITDNTYEVISLMEGETMTDEALKDVEVLIVPCSFNQYSTSEVDAIEKFVKEGGGLFLIADHSNFANAMDDIAWRFHVRWAHDVVTDSNDYTGPYNYWIVWEDNGIPGDDNMPLNNNPGYQNDPDEIWQITQYAPTVQYYCSNAYVYENPAESIAVIATDTDGTSNYYGEPACLAIPNGNVTGAGKAVFITDSNVFGDMWYQWGNPDGDCDDDGIKDFWDEHNAEFGLGVVDWLAPDAYEIGLISGEKDPDSGLPKPLVHMYEPGETHTYKIEVWNLGLRKDTIELEIPEVEEGWSASLDKLVTREMGPRNKEIVNLTITAPWTNLTDGEYALINVTATSINDPENATDDITSTNIVSVDIGFNLDWSVEEDDYGEKKKEVDPGKTSIISLGVKNIGNVNDSYVIRLQGVPKGWDVSLDTSANPEWDFNGVTKTVKGVTVPARSFENNQTYLRFSVRAPIDAHEGMNALINAIGESVLANSTGQDAQGDHDDEVKLIVSSNRMVELYCEDDELHVDPGKSVSFLVSVKNNGNGQEKVELSMGSLISDWTGSISSPTVILQPRQKKIVRITLTAPETAREGSRCVVKLEVRMHQQKNIADDLALTAIVNQYQKINATIIGTKSFNVDPGKEFTFNISISNEGNGIVQVTTDMIQLAEGWEYEFIFDGEEVKNFKMEAFQTIEVTVSIKVPSNALADSDLSLPGLNAYPIGLNVTCDEKYIQLLASATVKRKSDLEVIWIPDTAEKTFDGYKLVSEPGGEVQFLIRVKNNGNAWDEVKLDIKDTPLYLDPNTLLERPWDIYFSSLSFREHTSVEYGVTELDFTRLIDVTDLDTRPQYIPNNTKTEMMSTTDISLRIPYRTTLWVSVTVKIPDSVAAEDTYFVVSSKCINNVALTIDDITCPLSVRNVELTISSKIILPSSVKAGELVSVSVQVGNMGEIMAKNVIVRLYADGKLVENIPVETILKGETQLVSFIWKVPDKEECKLTVTVDPDNFIVEKNEGNNTRSKTVSISGSSGFLKFMQPDTVVPVLLVLALLGVGIFGLLQLKKRGWSPL